MKSPIKGLLKNIFVVILIFLFIGAIFGLFSTPEESIPAVSITELAEQINSEEVKEIKVMGNNINITYNDDSKATSKKEIGETLSQALLNYGADQEKLKAVSFVFEEIDESWMNILSFLIMFVLPLLLIGVFFFIIFKNA